MPLVNIRLIEDVFSPEEKAAMIDKVTAAMIEVEGEAMRQFTWVIVDEVKQADWAIGGRRLKAADVQAVKNAAA